MGSTAGPTAGSAASYAAGSAVGALPLGLCRGGSAIGALPWGLRRGGSAVGAPPWGLCREGTAVGSAIGPRSVWFSVGHLWARVLKPVSLGCPKSGMKQPPGPAKVWTSGHAKFPRGSSIPATSPAAAPPPKTSPVCSVPANPLGKTAARSESSYWENKRNTSMAVRASWPVVFPFRPSSSRVKSFNEDCANKADGQL